MGERSDVQHMRFQTFRADIYKLTTGRNKECAILDSPVKRITLLAERICSD